MEEWNLRLRAQKEEERKKKTESAEMLRKHQGGQLKEEDMKLSAIRQEERRKQTETAQMLQNYRGGVLSEEQLKLSQLKQEDRKKHQEAEHMLRNYRGQHVEGETKERPAPRRDPPLPPVVTKNEEDYRSAIAEGTVSGIKNRFDNSPRYDRPMTTSGNSTPTSAPNRSTILRNHQSSSSSSDLLPPTIPTLQVEAPVTAQNPFENFDANTQSIVHDFERMMTAETTTASSVRKDESTTRPIDAPTVAGKTSDITSSTEEDKAEIEKKNEDASGDNEEQEPSTRHVPSMEYFQTDNNVATTLNRQDSNDDMMLGNNSMFEQRRQHQQQQVPTQTKVDVLFSFGLITNNPYPALDGYMSAVRSIVQRTVQQDETGRLSYKATSAPFVTHVDWDDAYADPGKRRDVRRAVVTATASVFLTTGDGDAPAPGSVRDKLIEALSSSIHSGSFVQMALHSNR